MRNRSGSSDRFLFDWRFMSWQTWYDNLSPYDPPYYYEEKEDEESKDDD